MLTPPNEPALRQAFRRCRGSKMAAVKAEAYTNVGRNSAVTIAGEFTFEHDADSVRFNVETGDDLVATEINMRDVPRLIEQLAHAYRLAITPSMVAA